MHDPLGGPLTAEFATEPKTWVYTYRDLLEPVVAKSSRSDGRKMESATIDLPTMSIPLLLSSSTNIALGCTGTLLLLHQEPAYKRAAAKIATLHFFLGLII